MGITLIALEILIVTFAFISVILGLSAVLSFIESIYKRIRRK